MFYVCGWRKTFYEQSYSECLARWGLHTWCELTHSNIKHVIVAHIRTHARMICLIDDNDDAFERKFPRYPWRINYTELKNFSEHPMWTNIRPYSLRYRYFVQSVIIIVVIQQSSVFCGFTWILMHFYSFLFHSQNKQRGDAPSVSDYAKQLFGSMRCSRRLCNVSVERRRRKCHAEYNKRKRGQQKEMGL